MKSKLSLLLGVLMVLSIALPMGAAAAEDTPGGWTVSKNNAITEEVEEAFYNALDESYVPLVYCGSQVVAGMNHMIVCEKDGEILSVVIYEDLDGNASELEDMREVLASKGGEAGGWTIPANPPIKLPADAGAAHREIYRQSFVPLLYCGSQVVSGTNYKILYRSRTKIFTAVLYEDLDGNVQELADQRQILIGARN